MVSPAPTAIDATSAAGPKNPSIFFILPHDHSSVYTPVGSGMEMVAQEAGDSGFSLIVG